ncbi:hypothetical protein GCM10025771_13690 [Niveibacterium umoris]|uniref:DUF2628 domain-containing protein n=1 Tax=Niveibacterium umoris TaxID=1193620 RepID=A0A840BU83_9RHOO|nr:DUF2628 domain-containing protein [Niveibacterium umoris]MBB4014949.1 hypothetical protein [Niveibacterium umoris]
MTIYRVLKAEKRPTIVVKKGFCWPALFVAPFWALYKKFWPLAAVTAGVAATLNFAVRYAIQNDAMLLGYLITGAHVAFLIFVAKNANLLLTSYLLSKGYEVTDNLEAESYDEALDLANGIRRGSKARAT